MNNKMYTINESEEQYVKAKRSIGICPETGWSMILVTGENSLQLINNCSVRKVDDKIFSSCYTLFYRKKKIISEVLILRLSLYRFLVITDKFKPVYRSMKKQRRKLECGISDVSYEYSLFSFHGDNSESFFNNLDYKYIYKTKRQNYVYYQLLCPKKDENITYRHFINLNFVPIGNDANKMFLYDNNVVLFIDKIPKKYRLSVGAAIYPFENLIVKERKIKIVKYELESNHLVTNRHKVYSYARKKAGIIHCTFRLPQHKYPFVIAFVEEPKVRKVSLIKIGKIDALIRPVAFY